jgi:hypothetical protein
MIVPVYNAYKSNWRTKVGCTRDKIYVLMTYINVVLCVGKVQHVFRVMNLHMPSSLQDPAMKQNEIQITYND